MPNVFEKIATTLDESTVDVLISVQAGNLGTVQISLRQFKDNAQAELDAFLDDLNNVPLPQSGHAEDLENSFNAIRDILPDEVSGLSVTISEDTQAIIDHIQGAYLAPLAAFFELYKCIDELILSFPDLAFSGSGGSPGPAASVDFVISGSLKTSLEALGDAFDDLISPLSGVSGLMAVAVVISYLPRQFFTTDQLAYLDEVQQTVETLVAWANDPNSIPPSIQAALESVEAFLGDCFDDQDLVNLIEDAETAAKELYDLYVANNPAQDLSDFTDALDQLVIGINSDPTDFTKIDAGLVVLTPARAAAFKDKLQSISTGFFNGTTDEEFAVLMEKLLDKLEEKLLMILNKFNPAFETDPAIHWPQLFPPKGVDLDLDDVLEVIKQGLRGLCRLVEKLNLETISQDLSGDASAFQGDVNDWKDDLEGFFAQVSGYFTTIDDHVDDIQMNLADFFDAVEAELADFGQTVSAEITQILDEVQTSIADFVTLAEDEAGSFTYEDLEASLDEFMQTVSEILMEFSDDLERINQQIQKVLKELDNYSFKTVSDLVVELIDEATLKLAGIDRDELNSGLLLALTAALVVIPTKEQLREKMDLLQQRLDELIESGPVALLERIKDKPAEILEKIEEKSPVPLIKEQLSAFYDDIIETVDEFEPSRLLAPIKTKLDEIQQKIDDTANPCHELDAIMEVHQDLMAAYDRLDPDKIVEFLEEKRAQVAEAIEEAIPGPLLDKIIGYLTAMNGTPDKLKVLIDNVYQLISSYTTNPAGQIDSWLLDIINTLNAWIPDPLILDPIIQGIKDKIDELKEKLSKDSPSPGDLEAHSNIALTLGLIELLANPEDPEIGLIGGYLHAYNGLSTIPNKINALPEPYKTKVLLVLTNFDPYQPDISHDLSALKDLVVRIKSYDDKFIEILDRMMGENGPLYACLPADANAIKQDLIDCIVKEFKEPLLQLIEWLTPLADFLDKLKTEVDAFLNCLPDISGMATALQTIKTTLEGIQTTVATIDLTPATSFVTTYNTTRDALASLAPEDGSSGLPALKAQVCATFEELRNSLQFSELLTSDQIDSLDASYQNLVDVAGEFDPVLWVEESLKEEFDRLLGPYVEEYDLTQIFYDLLERLDQLREELKEELDRIFDEFIEMLDAVPRLESPAQIQISF